ncbi:uncharacterized protein [Ptychodera flava]|uniref:uncharacterized protein n=1 Tax=Ptychodera flava TaxID=63121 RepID=UPI00396A074C
MTDIKGIAKLREDNRILLEQLRQNQKDVKVAVSATKDITHSKLKRKNKKADEMNLSDVDVSSIYPDYRDRSPLSSRTRSRKNVRVERAPTSSTPKRPRKPRSMTPTRGKSPAKVGKQSSKATDRTEQDLAGSFICATSEPEKEKIAKSKVTRSEKLESASAGLSDDATVAEQDQENLSQSRHSEFLNSYLERSRREGLRPRNRVPRYSEKLLSDGNDRRQARVAREMMKKPRSILMTPGGKNVRTPSKVSFLSPDQSQPMAFDERQGQPLLGYDWIAGLLDNDESIAEKSQHYFDEIKEFRRVNNDECFHRSFAEGPKTPKSPLSPQSTKTKPPPSIEDEDQHTCIHSYRLNSRLYAVPIHKATDGDSECPICKTGRKNEERRGSPSYIRVSIPRSTLASPYRLRPHRRRSFDPTDSVSLSQHCLAGWESSRPSMMPSAHSMDLKDSLDVPNKAAAMSTIGKWANKVPVSLSPSKKSLALLNKSHALRYSVQQIEKERPWEKVPPAKSTDYPLL